MVPPPQGRTQAAWAGAQVAARAGAQVVEGGDGITAEGTRGTKAQRQDARGGDQREGGRRCEDEKAWTPEPRVLALAQDGRCSKSILTMVPAMPECRKFQGEHIPVASSAPGTWGPSSRHTECWDQRVEHDCGDGGESHA